MDKKTADAFKKVSLAMLELLDLLPDDEELDAASSHLCRVLTALLLERETLSKKEWAAYVHIRAQVDDGAELVDMQGIPLSMLDTLVEKGWLEEHSPDDCDECEEEDCQCSTGYSLAE